MLFSEADILQQVRLLREVPMLIEALAKRRLIEETAQDVGLTATTEELQKASDSLRIRHQLQSTDATWRWLQKYYLSLDDFEAMARVMVLSGKLAHHLFADKVDLTFGQNYLDYSQVAFYEVIFRDYGLAMELYYSLQEAELTFSEVVARYCQDRENQRRGGYQGFWVRSQLIPEIASVIFTAQPPEILKPIKTPQHTHLVRVEEIVRPSLDKKLRQKILADLFSDWLAQQIKTVEATFQPETSQPPEDTASAA